MSGITPDQTTKEKLIMALGNVAGVAAIDENVRAKKFEPEAVVYTVKKGDTLWGIAAAHHGDGSKCMTIFDANRPMLKDPDKSIQAKPCAFRRNPKAQPRDVADAA